jgi:capsid protein
MLAQPIDVGVDIWADSAGQRFGYDAISDTKRRKAPASDLKSEDKQLSTAQRKTLVASARDLPRNFSAAAWALSKHLDYVSTFFFRPKTGDPGLNRELERLVNWWQAPANFHHSHRHGRARFLRLVESSRTVEGDVFLQRLASGRLAGIEGDRIRTPYAGLPNGLSPNDLTHGVKLDKAGRAQAYALHNRSGAGFRFERLLSAKNVIHHAYYQRLDQVRGVSPLAPALNALRDTYECFDYALAKAKVSQLFALATFEDDSEPAGDVTTATDSDGNLDRSATTEQYAAPPIRLRFKQDDKAEFLESKTPSTEFQVYAQLMLALSFKALDIPYSFFDESFTNYSGSRQALLLYEQSAANRRLDNRLLLNALTAWRIALWIRDGILTPPKKKTARGLGWEWIASGVPWIDPLKEIKADREAIAEGLQTRDMIVKRRLGLSFADIAADLLEEETEMAKIRKIRESAHAA